MGLTFFGEKGLFLTPDKPGKEILDLGLRISD